MANKNMTVEREEQILDPGVRAAVMEAIKDGENVRRKNEMFRRWEILKDQTAVHVRALLFRQFDAVTVDEMEYAITNYSIGRKIIKKLAKVYSNGVKRSMPKKAETQAVEAIVKSIKLNTKMKKVNSYLKSAMNAMIYVKPVKVRLDSQNERFRYDVLPLFPYNYDVIENPENREEPMVVILSDFSPTQAVRYSPNPAAEGRTVNTSSGVVGRGNGQNSVIADDPRDAGGRLGDKSKRYIWWSKNFHFTTDESGEIVSGTDVENPINLLPMINIADEQDGQFWALGADDITDQSIKINALITHVNHVAITQGYGQLVISGPNIPKSVKVGPNHAINLEKPEGETSNAEASFISANPPIDQLMGLATMQVGLLLSTNNLSTKGIQTDLSGAGTAESGIRMLLDMSELVDEIEEDESLFIESEPEIFERCRRWDELYRSKELLVDEQARIKMPSSFEQLEVNFPPAKPIVSEKEELDVIKMRREMGINTEIELLQRDNPSMTEKQAMEKLMKLNDEKIKRLMTVQQNMIDQRGQSADSKEEVEDDDLPLEDNENGEES